MPLNGAPSPSCLLWTHPSHRAQRGSVGSRGPHLQRAWPYNPPACTVWPMGTLVTRTMLEWGFLPLASYT